MERLVESIHVPCPNAAHGCGARPAYYDQHVHYHTCPHAPRRCPGKDCSFIGSTEALLDHLTGAHGWPPTTEISAFEKYSIPLYDGFNFILVDDAEDDDDDDDHFITTTTTSSSSSRYLLLLNVTQQPLGRSITVHFIGQELRSEGLICVLSYSRVQYHPDHHKFLCSHSLKSKINVECMDLADRLPDPAACFQFIVPDSVLGNIDKKDAMHIEVRVDIINLE
jgi:E3 ubiquitin-protein ligase SIAH1